jgi:IclR family acetate operon transcriptional repressor
MEKMDRMLRIDAVPDLADEKSGSPGAVRTLAILETLSAVGDAGLTASEIARSLELPANSTLRILEVLEDRGYVERGGEDRRFRLTGRLLDLARPRLGDRSLAALAFDALCGLRDATGETAQLCVRAQNRCVIIEQAASRQPVKVLGEVGFRVPLYSCAPGKAMLAALPPAELAAFFKQVKLKRFTPTTLATRETLTAALAESRKRGYAVDRAEGLPGIHCVGAAILDRRGHPVGGLTVIGPAFRVKETHFRELGRRCIAAAREIARRIDG